MEYIINNSESTIHYLLGLLLITLPLYLILVSINKPSLDEKIKEALEDGDKLIFGYGDNTMSVKNTDNFTILEKHGLKDMIFVNNKRYILENWFIIEEEKI